MTEVLFLLGVLLLVGANPFDADRAQSEGLVALTLMLNLSLALVAVLKGRVVLGVVGVFVPFVALVGAVRLARPASPWARWRYPEGSAHRARSLRRFPPGRRNRWDALVDLFTAVPPPAPAPTR